MNVLVTGGSGLVGRPVVGHLAKTFHIEVLDKNPPVQKNLPFLKADILDLPALLAVIKGFDAVVHLAGIPHPLDSPPEKVFHVNALGTFNVLEACARNRIKRVVFMSSESTLGFAFSTTRMWPDYVPIDERHSLRPQDPYGLSKVVCEQLCAGVARRTGMSVVALRAPWIWVPEEEEIKRYRQLVSDYPRWHKNLWAFIHVSDVAVAVEHALRYDPPSGFDAFFISARENWTGRESRLLLKEFFPETRSVGEEWSGSDSFISGVRAKELLGFSPTMTAEDLLQ